MKTISYRSTHTARGQSKFCSMSISLTYFLKSILLHENWRGGGELLLKNVQ